MEHTCRNCGAEFNGKFCSNCGQKFDPPRFTWKHIFEEAFHSFTHADKSFLTYARELVINPGKLAYEYIVERKRKKYFNPFTFFLLVTAINLFIDGFYLELEEKIFHGNNEYGHAFNVYGKALLFAAIPVSALGLWLLSLRKPRLLYSEYTVFAMILISANQVIKIFTGALEYVILAVTKSSASITENLVYLALIIIYFAYADYQFHRYLGKKSIVKSTAAGMVIQLSMAMVVLFIVWVVIRGFNGLGTLDMYGIRINSNNY